MADVSGPFGDGRDDRARGDERGGGTGAESDEDEVFVTVAAHGFSEGARAHGTVEDDRCSDSFAQHRSDADVTPADARGAADYAQPFVDPAGYDQAGRGHGAVPACEAVGERRDSVRDFVGAALAGVRKVSVATMDQNGSMTAPLVVEASVGTARTLPMGIAFSPERRSGSTDRCIPRAGHEPASGRGTTKKLLRGSDQGPERMLSGNGVAKGSPTAGAAAVGCLCPSSRSAPPGS